MSMTLESSGEGPIRCHFKFWFETKFRRPKWTSCIDGPVLVVLCGTSNQAMIEDCESRASVNVTRLQWKV